MSTLKHSLALLGSSWKIKEIEANFIHDVSMLDGTLDYHYEVIGVHSSWLSNPAFQRFMEKSLQYSPHLQVVLLLDQEVSAPKIMESLRSFPVCNTINTSVNEMDAVLLESLEKAQQQRQENQLQNLVQSQNEQLKDLYFQLEDGIKKRQDFLQEARRKTFVAQSRWETIRSASLAIHQARSIGEMERFLVEVLSQGFQVSICRILFSPHDHSFAMQNKVHSNFSSFQTPLINSEDSTIRGSVFFMRHKDRPFYREETDFLIKVTEIISLAIHRLHQLIQSEELKSQWEVTFNSVTDPMAVINSEYKIIQSNVAYQKHTGKSEEELSLLTCYKALFRRDNPCNGCQRGQNFRIQATAERTTFDVYSQSVVLDPSTDSHFVMQYHDISEKLRRESIILESTKLAELGVIGGSIAHEINNPLGGILSYLHLIKSELTASSEMYKDIESMEDGVRRCRKIIDDLLIYIRRPSPQEVAEVDFVEILKQSVQWAELQARALQIEIRWNPPAEQVLLKASHSLLQQAFQMLVQKSLVDLSRNNDPKHRGVIEIHLEINPQQVEVTIMDNALESAPELDFNVALIRQIFLDHGALLDFSAPSLGLRSAKISIPRPVFAANPT